VGVLPGEWSRKAGAICSASFLRLLVVVEAVTSINAEYIVMYEVESILVSGMAEGDGLPDGGVRVF
jgi:hypothetical protein